MMNKMQKMKKHIQYYLIGLSSFIAFIIMGYFIFETKGFGITELYKALFTAYLFFSLLIVGLFSLLFGMELSNEYKMSKENEEYYKKMQNINID